MISTAYDAATSFRHDKHELVYMCESSVVCVTHRSLNEISSSLYFSSTPLICQEER